MQPLGILVLTSGIWLVYSGVTGVPPLETLTAILANPSQASRIIADAKAKVTTSPATIKESFSVANPFKNWGISDTYAGHEGRHSESPGTDFKAPVGTPIPSPVSGVLTNNPSGGDGGYVASVRTSAGYVFSFRHLSRFRTDLNGKQIIAGQIIGYTGGKKGATGAGNSTGPHLHLDIRNPAGKYIDPVTYLNRSDNKVKAAF